MKFTVGANEHAYVNERGNRVLHDLLHLMLYFLPHAMHEGIERITYSSWQMQMVSSSVTAEEDSDVHETKKNPNRYFERERWPLPQSRFCQPISRCI